MKTSKDYTIADYRGYGEITVPAGTALTHMTASGIDTRYHFVDDFAFINNYPQFHKMTLLHDAMHYGIDVPLEYVDYELGGTLIDETAPIEVIDLRKTAPVMGNYYADQLKRITNPRSSFAPNIKIEQAKEHTNWMSLNDDSATELVKWLHEHYNIAQPKAEAYIVAYTSIEDEQDYYVACIDDDRLEKATILYNNAVESPDTAIASLCAVIKSTDYSYESQEIDV